MGSRKTDEGGQILELDDRIAFVAGSTETGRDAMGEKSLDERPCRFALYIHCKDTRQACREIPIYNFFFLTSNDKQAHSQPNDMSALSCRCINPFSSSTAGHALNQSYESIAKYEAVEP